jgi:hypothetical protein
MTINFVNYIVMLGVCDSRDSNFLSLFSLSILAQCESENRPRIDNERFSLIPLTLEGQFIGRALIHSGVRFFDCFVSIDSMSII